MTDTELFRHLSSLGIDDLSFRVLPLLPLVQVAWADGEVQDKERALIIDLAVERFDIGDEGRLLLENWLTWRPTPAYVRRGQQALLALARRERPDMPIEPSVLEDVVALSRDVAKAAGGLFGFGAISKEESRALADIADALSVSEGDVWAEPEEILLDKTLGEGRRRVTITFDTATLDISAQGGVLESELDPGLKAPVNREGLTVGSSDADICVLDAPDVAAQHCRFFERDRKFYVADLDAPAGTFVDEERVTERRLLGGETVRLGEQTRFVFKLLKRIPKQML